ncbi:MAG: AmmeMemoRadiSam system protein A [Thermovirgaceae bacterium]|nr:AmmeMemoRadiSam system protein A [Thermovirgaceae bacterium]
MSGLPASDVTKMHPYVILARKSIENTAKNIDPCSGIDFSELLLIPDLNIRRACFVSIKGRTGDLRGCIGTIRPSYGFIWEEIINNAHAAACRDPRFSPVKPKEAEQCIISVDVLEHPELVPELSALDPVVYGVIVEKGSKRGVLLPDLAGIDTPDLQVSIAMKKAGISSSEGMIVWRFSVSRFSE